MPSLLDMIMRRASPLLGNEPDPVPAPTPGLLGAAPPPNAGLLGSGPQDGKALAQAGLVPGSPALAPVGVPVQAGGVPAPAAPAAPQPNGPQDGKAQDLARRRERIGQTAGFTMRAIGRDLPDATVREIAEAESGDTGPGRPDDSFFTRLYLGHVPAGLNKKDVEALRRQSMITAGLFTLANASAGVEAIPAGIAVARQSATHSIGELMDEKNRQDSAMRYRSALNDGQYETELERYNEARRRALADGDLEAVKVLNDVIKELRELPEGADRRRFQVVGGDAFWIDDEQQKAYDLAGREITPELMAQNQTQGRPIIRQVRGADGLMHDVAHDPVTLQPIRDLGISEKAPNIKPGTPEGVTTANTLEREVGIMEGILAERDFRPFDRVTANVAREAQPAEFQRFNAAAQNVLSLIVRARSGAQATDAEVRRLESFAVPLPGDDPTTVTEKMARLRDMITELRGGASPSAPRVPVDLNAADAILNDAGGN